MNFRALLLFILFIPSIGYSGYIPYCKGTKTSSIEDAIIQRLVLQFGNKMGCEIGDNCLLKWDVNEKNKTEKFSIAWKEQCGPVINGVWQLGDNGHGSTFVCEIKNNNTFCCWPLGYDYVKEFVMCWDENLKRKMVPLK